MVVTTKTACEFFSVDRSTLGRWRDAFDEKGAYNCYINKNKWDLRKLVELWADNVHGGDSKLTGDDALDGAKRQYWQAKARVESVRADQAERSVFSREEVVSKWRKKNVAVCTGLELFADRLPPLLEGHNQLEMREIIDKEVGYLRNSYGTIGEYCPPCDPDKKTKISKKKSSRIGSGRNVCRSATG